MRLFFDGKIQPEANPPNFIWKDGDFERICYNCGKDFGKHDGYKCPNNEARSRT